MNIPCLSSCLLHPLSVGGLIILPSYNIVFVRLSVCLHVCSFGQESETIKHTHTDRQYQPLHCRLTRGVKITYLLLSE